MTDTTAAPSMSAATANLKGSEKKIQLTHILTLLATGVALTYIIICLLLKFNTLAFFSLGIAVLFASMNLLNRYKFYDLARMGLIITANIFVFYLSNALGRDSGIRSLYFPLLGAIFMIFNFKEYYKTGFLFLLTFAAITVGEFYDYSLFLIPGLSHQLESILSVSTFFAANFTSLACIYYLVNANVVSEKTLETERNNTKAIIDNTEDIIMLINTNYELLSMNKALESAFRRIFGDKLMMGVNMIELINSSAYIPAQFKAWQQYYDRAFKGEHFSFEEKSQTQTGEPRYFETEVYPVYQNNEITGAAIFLRDITPRKKLEQSIVKLNSQQSAIIDGANYSILSLGLDGIVTSFNRGSEKMLGYEPEEVIGKLGPHNLLSSKQLVTAAKDLTDKTGRTIAPGFEIFKAMAELGEDENEWTVTTKNGNKITLSSSITTLKDQAGAVFGYLIISSNITDKKLAQEQLEIAAEEDKQRVWVNAGITEIAQLLRMREDDTTRFCTPVLAFISKYTGASQASLFVVKQDQQGNNILEQVAGYAVAAGQTKKIFQFGESLVGQVAIEQKTLELKDLPAGYMTISSSLGESSPTQVIIMPMIFQNELVGVIELATFNEFENREKQFMERANPIFAASIDLINRRLKTESLLRESLELNERLKTQEEELRVGNEELTEKTNLLQASEEELRVQQEELMHVNVQMEEKATLLEEQNEAMHTKNTQLESAREALKLKAEELEVTSRYKSEFLANMSHELRTPLNSILILSKLLGENKENQLSAKQLEFAQVIQRSGVDLLNLINDILDLSKIEARKIDLEIEDVPVNQIRYSMDSLFREMANEKEIIFTVSIKENGPETFTGDKVRTEQILKNLLSNAFKFTPKGKTIDLLIYFAESNTSFTNPYLLKSKRNICFEVKDGGIGISEEKQQLIFEAFRQADGSTIIS